MGMREIRLSVEELALVMSLIGQPEAGHATLIAQLGQDLNQADVQGRLLAAGHSLLARGWIDLDIDGHFHLSESLQHVGHILTAADFSLRCSRSHRDAEFVYAVHFKDGIAFEHSTEYGVVNSITELEAMNILEENIAVFFEIPLDVDVWHSEASITSSLLNTVRNMEDATTIMSRLLESSVPPELAQPLSMDLSEPVHRGSIIRVDYGFSGTAVPEKGLLTLRGPNRSWLFRVSTKDEASSVTILPGDRAILGRELAAMCQPLRSATQGM